jgi:hypothetical protein
MQCFAKGKCPYMSTALLVRQVVKTKSVDGYCTFTHYYKMSIYYKRYVQEKQRVDTLFFFFIVLF